MNKYTFMIPLLIFVLFYNSSCEREENQRFIIQNNSDKEIIIINAHYHSIAQDTSCFIQKMTEREYSDFIRDRMIKPHSSKNFERGMWGEYMISYPNDTFYFGVFYRADIDTMSCDEFKQKYPLKKEWQVTLADMEVCDWTLVYTPEE